MDIITGCVCSATHWLSQPASQPASTLLSVVSRLNHWHEIAHQNPAFVSSQFIRPEEPTRAAINSGTAIGHVSTIWGNVSDWIACQNVINLFLFSSFSLKIPIGKLCGWAGAEHWRRRNRKRATLSMDTCQGTVFLSAYRGIHYSQGPLVRRFRIIIFLLV